jgi:cell division protein FtsW
MTNSQSPTTDDHSRMANDLPGWLRRNLKGDIQIWGVVLILSLMSVFVVYSAVSTKAVQELDGNTEAFLLKHGLLVLVGLACTWIASRIDYVYFADLAKIGLWLSVVLLLWVFFQPDPNTINEANRSIRLPVINLTFQPSDLAKLALISNLAFMLARRRNSDWNRQPELLLNMILWIASICGLIALANASTALLLASTSFLLLFIGGVPPRYLFITILACGLAGGIGLAAGQRFNTAVNRVKKMQSDTLDTQVEMGRIAIAGGGLVGKGPGNSRQKNVLPEPFSDFIYAIIVEEYGLLGGLFTLGIYLWLLWRGMQAIRRSTRPFGGLLSAGLTFSIVIQALINMGVVVGLGPVTGLPLPLLSMGGTSLIFSGTAIGIVLSVSRDEADESRI